MLPRRFESWLQDSEREPVVMGVLNVTPDSFSDGGKFASPDAAVAHARDMADAGADLIDIGGESTRPGSAPVPAAEQIRRVSPVLERIATSIPATFSIDTSDATVASAALDAGAAVVNDITAGRGDPEMLSLVARRGTPIILMHMQGTPATMQIAPSYSDVVAEVIDFLRKRIAAAEAAGIDRERILIDPGIGFGKSMAHNLALLRRLGEFKQLGRPLVVGVSRKKFIGTLSGETDPPREGGRLFGTAAAVGWSIANGADIVRVHDVGPMRQVVAVVRAIGAG